MHLIITHSHPTSGFEAARFLQKFAFEVKLLVGEAVEMAACHHWGFVHCR
jgi:hypothetical protein